MDKWANGGKKRDDRLTSGLAERVGEQRRLGGRTRFGGGSNSVSRGNSQRVRIGLMSPFRRRSTLKTGKRIALTDLAAASKGQKCRSAQVRVLRGLQMKKKLKEERSIRRLLKASKDNKNTLAEPVD